MHSLITATIVLDEINARIGRADRARRLAALKRAPRGGRGVVRFPAAWRTRSR